MLWYHFQKQNSWSLLDDSDRFDVTFWAIHNGIHPLLTVCWRMRSSGNDAILNKNNYYQSVYEIQIFSIYNKKELSVWWRVKKLVSPNRNVWLLVIDIRWASSAKILPGSNKTFVMHPKGCIYQTGKRWFILISTPSIIKYLRIFQVFPTMKMNTKMWNRLHGKNLSLINYTQAQIPHKKMNKNLRNLKKV